MIEFLSSSDWINPQLNFLELLQTIRIEHFEFLNKAFLGITILGEMWLPVLICSIIYWCIDTKKGLYLFTIFSFELLFSQFFKMIACVYRPWILSDKIHPVELAIPAAKGYSFPSGHSATASSILGGLAYLYRQNKFLCCLLVLLVLSVGFSRMWLGVHTPQDVIVGLTIGFILIFCVNYFINWADKNKQRYLYSLVVVDILVILALVYICIFNVYPTDYIDGKLLVNPEKSIYTAVTCSGYAIGMINGAFLCRKFTNFDAKEGDLKSKITRGLLGTIFVFILLKVVGNYIFNNISDYKISFFVAIIIGLFITFIYPLIISLKLKNTK